MTSDRRRPIVDEKRSLAVRSDRASGRFRVYQTDDFAMNGSSLCARPHSSLHRSPLQSVSLRRRRTVLPVGRLLRPCFAIEGRRASSRRASGHTRARPHPRVARPHRSASHTPRSGGARPTRARRDRTPRRRLGGNPKIARPRGAIVRGWFFFSSVPPSLRVRAERRPRRPASRAHRADPRRPRGSRRSRTPGFSRAPPRHPRVRPASGFFSRTLRPPTSPARSPFARPSLSRSIATPPPSPLTPLAPPSHATAAFALPSPSHHPPLARETR